MKNLIILLIVIAFGIGAKGTIEKNRTATATATGVVKYYNEDKGFGYIIDKSSEELYVYETELVDEIESGDKVMFLVRNTRKGLEAYEVRKLIEKN
jgi:CspA family cold shock protein